MCGLAGVGGLPACSVTEIKLCDGASKGTWHGDIGGCTVEIFACFIMRLHLKIKKQNLSQGGKNSLACQVYLQWPLLVDLQTGWKICAKSSDSHFFLTILILTSLLKLFYSLLIDHLTKLTSGFVPTHAVTWINLKKQLLRNHTHHFTKLLNNIKVRNQISGMNKKWKRKSVIYNSVIK